MHRSHIAIIGAPLDLGSDRRGVDMGPSALRVANINKRVASLGYEVEDLGTFIEFEAVAPTESDLTEQHRHVDELRAAFGIDDDRLCATGYAALIFAT